MKQPFELKYIKRYLLMYAGVVVVAVLFYFINRANNPVEIMEPKKFSTQSIERSHHDAVEANRSASPFRLLDVGY